MNKIKDSKLFYLLLGILAIIFSLLIIWTTNPHNVGFTPDSVTYLSAARIFATGNYYHNTSEPPFYPLFLALVTVLFRIDPFISARFINAILFGSTIYITGLLMKKIISYSNIIFLGLIFIGLSNALIAPSLKAWTETLFIFLTTLFLYFLMKFIEIDSYNYLIITALLAGMAAITRFMGISLILTGLFHLIFIKNSKFKTKFLKLLLFILISSTPITLFFLHNFEQTGSFLGYDIVRMDNYNLYSKLYNFYEAGTSIFYKVTQWFIFEDFFAPFFLIMFGFLFGLVFSSGYKKIRKFSFKNLKNSPFIFYILIYLVVLFAIVGMAGHIEARYLSPIFIPLTILLIYFVENFVSKLKEYFHQKTNLYIVYIILILFIFLPINKTYMELKNQFIYGSGYTDLSWQKSETISYLLTHKKLISNYKIYTNDSTAKR